ncbi:MAG TPA: caspase family protein, partial [Bradyrhizobium sp.]|nr:caspase family protein [Bradyrhizobium sp.]
MSAAKSVADWLDREQFKVVAILDDAAPVTANAVRQAVTDFVNQPSLTQLVVYFSGHGMSVGFNEYWLLSGAPDDPNEAVSLVECFELAHMSGIPNVVFISDACRSTSPDFNTSLIRGTLIFPNRPAAPGGGQTDVDRFLATGPGAASFEARVA